MIQIDILINGEELYGGRRWNHIPRKGDFIKLGGKKEGWYSIDEVNWHGDEYPIVTLHVSKEVRK